MATICCVRLSIPLKTSPNDPLPMRSCLVNMSSGSTFCKKATKYKYKFISNIFLKQAKEI